MKVKLSGWSIALLLIIIILVLDLIGIIPHVNSWDILWIVVTIGSAWLIYYIFLKEKIGSLNPAGSMVSPFARASSTFSLSIIPASCASETGSGGT